jgi:hypothetical protein
MVPFSRIREKNSFDGCARNRVPCTRRLVVSAKCGTHSIGILVAGSIFFRISTMRLNLHGLNVGWNCPSLYNKEILYTVGSAQPTVAATAFRRQPPWFFLFALLYPLCLAIGYLPVAASTSVARPVFVDETQNNKAMGYTDSRKVVRDTRGNLYVAYRKKYKQQYETAYHIFVAQSIDNGVHWRVLNDGQPIETVGDFNQRVPAIAIDQHDVLHVVWYGPDASTHGGDENQIKYVRSVDYGERWSTWQNINFVTGFEGQELWQEHPTIYVDNTNTLYIVWEGRDAWYRSAGQIKFTKSSDGGLSWTPWLNIAPSKNSHSRPSLVATTENRLYAFAYGSVNGLQQILFSDSSDGGTEWSRWRQVAASGQDQRHVSTAVDQTGRIHIVWQFNAHKFTMQISTAPPGVPPYRLAHMAQSRRAAPKPTPALRLITQTPSGSPGWKPMTRLTFRTMRRQQDQSTMLYRVRPAGARPAFMQRAVTTSILACAVI